MKQTKYTFRGANRDVTKSKHPTEYYFDAEHIRVLATDSQSTGSVTNEKGNVQLFDLGTISVNTSTNVITYTGGTKVYTNGTDIDVQISSGDMQAVSGVQKIIGHAEGRDSIFFISTDDNGGDAIWEMQGVLENNYTLNLLYYRNMNLSTNNPVQIIYNYENEDLQKIYWVDGVNQIRTINIKDPDLIDVPLNTINFVGDFDLSQATIDSISTGGNQTAGMVQYTYNLYRLNSSQTKTAPLSELVPLTRGDGLGGGDVNEQVSSTPVVSIDDIDDQFTFIRVYAIRYTSFNVTPQIELIDERELGNQTSITIFDDGSNIGSLSLEEFLFLGSDPIIPEHIVTKDNVLFPVNITESNFLIPDEFDMRAYGFPISNNITSVNDNVRAAGNAIIGDILTLNGTDFSVPINHDAVNLDYDIRRYQANSTIEGGEGKYLKYEFVRKAANGKVKVFKDAEIYRIGIEFYNKLGQVSLSKWIADFKAPTGNLSNLVNTISVTLKPEFYTFLNGYTFASENDRPVGYRIIRADRTESDKTIISQGAVTGMIFQVKGDEARNFGQFTNITNRRSFQDGALKLPSYITRNFQKIPNSGDNNGALQENKHLEWLNDDNPAFDEGGEIYTVTNDNNKISQTFQHTKMMQMHSPEVLFDIVNSYPADVELRNLGIIVNNQNGVFAEERFVETGLEKFGGRTLGGLNPKRIDTSNFIENNNFRNVFDTPEGGASNNDNRFIGPSGGGPELTMCFYQYYRQFTSFQNDANRNVNPIYGSPEVTDRGGESRFYNGDTRYNYTNSLTPFSSDPEDDCDTCDPISSINSFASRNTTFVLGNASDSTDNRLALEDLYDQTSLGNPTSILLAEIKREDKFTYLGGIYGGNSFEDKKRSTYIQCGEYTDINTATVQIDNPGDTFVQTFRFLRIAKTDTEVLDHRQAQISEIIQFPVETTVDLESRYDISINAWDGRFQPQEDEYHGYNRVYSQQPNLVVNTDIDFNQRIVENFDTRVTATRTKIPNEEIDSWTDILVNEFQDLDGKYGPINGVLNYKDEIFTFQDEAIAKLIINPRVQVQGSNGIDVELGRGTLLYDYDYITTTSGARNKWAIIEGKKGFYYYDLLNKGLFRYPDNVLVSLSDAKGMHTYFNNNFVHSDLVQDNPVLFKGAVMGADIYNNDIWLTLHQGDQSLTRVYNELQDEFVDSKLYYPVWYVNKAENLFATTDTTIWEQYAGPYNNYFGQNISSKVILQLNPAVDLDTIFHNIFYRSEVYLSDIDQPDSTLTHIRGYSEYQDSGRIPLVLSRNGNLRRKFRQWRADIPREAGTRNKLRNPWIFLELEFSNSTGQKLILHDIIISYTIYR